MEKKIEWVVSAWTHIPVNKDKDPLIDILKRANAEKAKSEAARE